MTTIRIVHEKEYTVIANAAIQDKRLSFKARGLHHLLLSYPDGWEINTKHLMEQSDRDGRDAINAGLKELKDLNYLVRRCLHDKESGKFEWVTELYELPQEDAIASSPIDGKPINGKPVHGEKPENTTINGKPVNGSAVNGLSDDGLTVNGSAVNGKPVNIVSTKRSSTYGSSTKEESKECDRAFSQSELLQESDGQEQPEEKLEATRSKSSPVNSPVEKSEGDPGGEYSAPPKISQPKSLSAAQRSDLSFQRFEWGFVKTPDPEFLDYLVKVDLPTSGAYRDRPVNKRTAQTWVLGILDSDFTKSQRREIQVQQAWEAYLEWKAARENPAIASTTQQTQIEFDPETAKQGVQKLFAATRGVKHGS